MTNASLVVNSEITARPEISAFQSSCAKFRGIAATQNSPSHEIDCEERRWQLEWDRRNIED